MNYEDLLKNAPAHDSDEFLDYLREHNKVVFDNGQWLVIENVKYHNLKGKPWYTAFHKTTRKSHVVIGSTYQIEWYNDIDILWSYDDWAEWEWLKKSADKQTVNRFHIHIYKP